MSFYKKNMKSMIKPRINYCSSLTDSVKLFLKIPQNLQKKFCAGASFFKIPAKLFTCVFCKIFKSTYFVEHPAAGCLRLNLLYSSELLIKYTNTDSRFPESNVTKFRATQW